MFGDCLPNPLIHACGILLNVRDTHHVVGYFDTHFGVDMLPNMRWSGPWGGKVLRAVIVNRHRTIPSLDQYWRAAAQLGR
jgi:hypothetical protein